MKLIIVLISIIFIVTGCESKNNENKKVESNKSDYHEIIKNNNYIIIDVRTKEEYDEGHIKDAINIPYDEIDENTDLDKSKVIMVYCKSGGRSNKAYNTLKNLGYEVYDLGAYQNIDLEKE